MDIHSSGRRCKGNNYKLMTVFEYDLSYGGSAVTDTTNYPSMGNPLSSLCIKNFAFEPHALSGNKKPIWKKYQVTRVSGELTVTSQWWPSRDGLRWYCGINRDRIMIKAWVRCEGELVHYFIIIIIVHYYMIIIISIISWDRLVVGLVSYMSYMGMPSVSAEIYATGVQPPAMYCGLHYQGSWSKFS